MVANDLAEDLGPGELDAVDAEEGTSLYLLTDQTGVNPAAADLSRTADRS